MKIGGYGQCCNERKWFLPHLFSKPELVAALVVASLQVKVQESILLQGTKSLFTFFISTASLDWTAILKVTFFVIFFNLHSTRILKEECWSYWVRLSELRKLGEVNFGMLMLDELGEVSFRMLKFGDLGKVSFGMLKLGEFGYLGELWNLEVRWVR